MRFIHFYLSILLSWYFFQAGYAQQTGSHPPVQPIVKLRPAAEVVNFTQLAKEELANPRKYRAKKHDVEQGEEREKGFKFTPRPVPADAIKFHVPASGAAPRATSPTPTGSWEAILDNGTEIPPDIAAATGLTYVLETTNQQFNIYTKTGTLVSTVSITHLFAPTGGNGYFDPHVEYDNNYGRYVICIDGNNSDGRSGLFLAISQTADPTQNWYVSGFDAAQNNGDFIDYPGLGYNKDWVVLTGNDFLNDGNNVQAMVYVMDRYALYEGSVGNVYEFPDNSGAFTIIPSQTYDTTQDIEYLVSNTNGDKGGSGYVQVGTITGSLATTPTYTAGVTLGVDQPWSDAAVMASQEGSDQTIDDDDDRIQNVVYRNGSLWFCHTVFLTIDDAPCSGADWWEINPATPALEQFYRLSGANQFYYYPSINVNPIGDALMGYCQSSTSEYASAAYAFHAATDAANTLETGYTYKSGVAGYYKTLGGGENRWGDFTGVSVDPVDNSFFVSGQWANTGNDWATQIAHVGPSTVTCKAVAAFNNTEPVACAAPYTVAFANASTNASNFVWYFGDGDTSTSPSPSHTYAANGVYTVSLVATSSTGCGQDTVTYTNLVNIGPSNTCAVILPLTGSVTEQTACSGTVYSDNGPTGLYSNQVTSTVTIAPTGASAVTLQFTKFQMQDNTDYLYVYNGPTVNSPLLASLTGTTLPANITSTAGSITLEEKTSTFVVDSGFAVNWTCVLPTTPPTANFSSVIDSCSGLVTFTDLSIAAQSWLWNFGDGTTSTLENPTHTYFNNGTYTVTLTATNSHGSNTKTATNYITINKPAAPTVTGGGSHCGPESVSLSASTTNGVIWYDTAGNTVSTSNPFVTAVLNTTTTYYAAQSIPQSDYTVGPANNNIGTGGEYPYNGATWGPVFTVNTPCTLVSVYVYATGAGDRTIEYLDSAGDILNQATVDLKNGGNTVTLNFPLSVGSDYSLQFADVINCYRNMSGAVYPYTDALGMVSITGNTAPESAANYYYFFYNWEVQPQNCVSQAAPVTVTINPVATVTLETTNPTCFGTDNGSVIAQVSGGTPGYAYSWSNNDITDTISNLGGGTYTVTVMDSKRCFVTATGTLTAPSSAISATATAINANCGEVTGSVSIQASGGAGSYTYLWSNGETTDTIKDVAPNSYAVTVTDANKCSTTASATVTGTNAVQLNTGHTNVTCHGEGNGSASVFAAGRAPYGYQWSPSAADTSVLNGLSGGTYNVTVTDANGCTATASITVTEPSLLQVSLTPSNARCGQVNGSVSSAVTGGTSPYRYFWNNSDTSANPGGLSAGPYSVTVYDANLCTVSAGTSVSSSGSLGVNDSITNVSCYGGDNGQAALSAYGGTAPYYYQWALNDTMPSVSGLTPGSYAFTITDVNGCSVESSVSVTGPVAPVSITVTAQNAKCYNEASGTAQVTVTGGTPGYTYNWSGAAGDSMVTGLVAGSYIVTVSDSYLCTATDTVQIGQPTPIDLGITSENVACYGDETGEASIKTVGGTAPYSYKWNTGSADSVLNGVGAGSYKITITDANGCNDSASITVNQPSAALSAAATAVGSTSGPATGSAAVSPSGGTSPYGVQWSTGASTDSINGLAGGNYYYTVTDANQCTDSGSVHVAQYLGINNVSSAITADIYPNPTTGVLNVTLHLTNNAHRVTLVLLDVLGNNLDARSYEPTQDIQTTFSLDNDADGIYFLEIRCGDDYLVKKVVLDR